MFLGLPTSSVFSLTVHFKATVDTVQVEMKREYQIRRNGKFEVVFSSVSQMLSLGRRWPCSAISRGDVRPEAVTEHVTPPS